MKLSHFVLFAVISAVIKVAVAAGAEPSAPGRVLSSGCPFGSYEEDYFVAFDVEVDLRKPDKVMCTKEDFDRVSEVVQETINSVGKSGNVVDTELHAPVAFEALECPADSSGGGTLRGRRVQCWNCFPYGHTHPGLCSGCHSENDDCDHGCRKRQLSGTEVSVKDKEEFKPKAIAMERDLRVEIFENLVSGVPCLNGLNPGFLFVGVTVNRIPMSETKCR